MAVYHIFFPLLPEVIKRILLQLHTFFVKVSLHFTHLQSSFYQIDMHLMQVFEIAVHVTFGALVPLEHYSTKQPLWSS